MKYQIKEIDKNNLLQSTVLYKYRVYIVDDNKNVLDMVEGISSIGQHNVDSQSDMRRTINFVLQLDEFYKEKSIEEKLNTWIGYNFQFKIGVFNLRLNDYIWYDCGYYTVTDFNTSYSSITNQLTISQSDFISKLNGSRDGILGGMLKFTIPRTDEKGNNITLKSAITTVLKEYTNGFSYIIDDLGEFYGMPDSDMDYVKYRQNNPDWNVIPYDLEFNGGCSVLDIIKNICELYPNNQCYFDIYGNFCVDMIPSCSNYPDSLSNEFLQNILVGDNSENVDYDITNVKNITEIFGKTYEPKRYSTSCKYSNNIYTITLENYTQYTANEYIAFTSDVANESGQIFIQFNTLGAIQLKTDSDIKSFEKDFIKSNRTYVIKLKKIEGVFYAIFCGQYQPHALCVLTNNANDTHYTKKYFAEKYEVDESNIIFRVEDSPFSVQKYKEVLDFNSGNEFNSIDTDEEAMSFALYYNKKSTTYNDVVTITTKLIPWLDVHLKVEYRKKQETESHEYIIKSISHNLENFTSVITMYRYYPLNIK